MLALLAAVLFAVDAILRATDSGHAQLIAVLAYTGLALLALAVAGFGPGWRRAV